ncbi:hypothetical protein DL771_001048 [Monosporascus sp. 5C6A]|nr:hypothetical protein DL771_001048 [Monosporascus sp. 5C6A]
MSQVGNFSWCPLGCGSGQFQDAGGTWHDEYTCDEYDSFLVDPLNFRSEAQIAGEAAEAADRAMDDLRRQIEDAERQFNSEILASRQRAEALRLAELARIERERQEVLERARRGEARRQAEEKRKLEARKKAEEDATQAAFTNRAFSIPVKPCPKCKTPIEKRGGCNHMYCQCWVPLNGVA